jgi:hypothetical protein
MEISFGEYSLFKGAAYHHDVAYITGYGIKALAITFLSFLCSATTLCLALNFVRFPLEFLPMGTIAGGSVPVQMVLSGMGLGRRSIG